MSMQTVNDGQLVPAVLYEVKTFGGNHEGFIKIPEIFIQSHNIAFNSIGLVHATQPRNVQIYGAQNIESPLKPIQLSLETVEKIVSLAQFRKEAEEKIYNLQKEVKIRQREIYQNLKTFLNAN